MHIPHKKLIGWGLIGVAAFDSIDPNGLPLLSSLPGGSSVAFSFIPTSGGSTTGPTWIDLILFAAGAWLLFF